MTKAIATGSKVRFVLPVDNYPYVLVKVGETGTYSRTDDEGSVWVKLDRYVAELNTPEEDFKNEVCIWDWSQENPRDPSAMSHIEAV